MDLTCLKIVTLTQNSNILKFENFKNSKIQKFKILLSQDEILFNKTIK